MLRYCSHKWRRLTRSSRTENTYLSIVHTITKPTLQYQKSGICVLRYWEGKWRRLMCKKKLFGYLSVILSWGLPFVLCASKTDSRETWKSPKSTTQSSRRWWRAERTGEELSINLKQVCKRSGEWSMKKTHQRRHTKPTESTFICDQCHQQCRSNAGLGAHKCFYKK